MIRLHQTFLALPEIAQRQTGVVQDLCKCGQPTTTAAYGSLVNRGTMWSGVFFLTSAGCDARPISQSGEEYVFLDRSPGSRCTQVTQLLNVNNTKPALVMWGRNHLRC